MIRSKENVKYLAVLLDHRLNFRDHLEYTANKANKIAGYLSRLMPNIGNSRQKSRNLMTSVCYSIILYAAL